MNASSPTRVVFFQINEPKAKLLRLVEMATFHFERKEPFLILVEEEKTEQYVDELLWKLPPTSFLPHAVVDKESQDLIAITRHKKNMNQARFAFNLCSTPLLIEGPFKIIYDFEDITSLNKKHLSELRFDAYKKSDWLIEARYS